MKTLREQKGLTQRQVAEATGMSPLAVLRYEQFIYEELSDKLAEFYAEEFPEETPNSVKAIYRFNRAQYQTNQCLRYCIPPPTLLIRGGEHPFITWRRTITTRAVGKESRMSFCILLALHPAVVADYESGKLKTMPKQIRSVLQLQIPIDYVNQLNSLGEIWHERNC